MLSPLAPAFGEECWETLQSRSPSTSSVTSPGTTPSIFSEAWPSFHESALKEDKIVCGIQVNGKSRFNIEYEVSELPGDKAGQEAFLRDLVYKHEKAQKWLLDDGGKVRDVKKMIVIKGGKLVSFVL